MNMQALMQQAKKMQKDMEKAKKEVEEQTFVGTASFVEVKVNGKKEMLNIKIQQEESIEKDDFELLEDMILVATNEALKKADKAMNDAMSKMAPNIPGLF